MKLRILTIFMCTMVCGLSFGHERVNDRYQTCLDICTETIFKSKIKQAQKACYYISQDRQEKDLNNLAYSDNNDVAAESLSSFSSGYGELNFTFKAADLVSQNIYLSCILVANNHVNGVLVKHGFNAKKQLVISGYRKAKSNSYRFVVTYGNPTESKGIGNMESVKMLNTKGTVLQEWQFSQDTTLRSHKVNKLFAVKNFMYYSNGLLKNAIKTYKLLPYVSSVKYSSSGAWMQKYSCKDMKNERMHCNVKDYDGYQIVKYKMDVSSGHGLMIIQR